MHINPFPAFALFSVLALPTHAQAQCELSQLMAPTAIKGGQFGASVDLNDRWAIIGAPADGPNDAAYVYRRSGNTWNFFQKLTAADGRRTDDFGHAVAISNGAIAIGAPKHGAAQKHAGAVYVYRFNGNTWNLETKLVASDAAASDHFGYSVAMAGHKLFVGAHLDDDMGKNSGSVYLFRHNGTWNETDKFIAPDGNAGDEFGASLAADANQLMIGCRSRAGGGAVYFCRFINGQWTEQDTLIPWNGQDGDRFGFSVGLHGNIAVIGAPRRGTSTRWNQGAAYVYRQSNGIWNYETTLIAADGATGDNFGHAVAVRGDRIAVTAVHDDDNGKNSGSTYLFRNTTNWWPLEDKFLPSDGSPNSQFGDAVALFGKHLLVGARFHNANASDGGAAYAFALASTIADFRHFGNGWAGTHGIPTLQPLDRPIMGTTLQITAENSRKAPTRAILLTGFDTANTPTSLGGEILVDLTTVLSIDFTTGGDQILNYDIPCDPSWDGQSAFLQVLTWDPGATHNVSFTTGLELIIGS